MSTVASAAVRVLDLGFNVLEPPVGARGASLATESIRWSCSAGVNGASRPIPCFCESVRGAHTSGSGESPVGVWFLTRRHARPVVLGEDLTDEFPAAANADLVEDGLEAIPNRVGRDVEFARDFGRGEPAYDELRYLVLALRQTVGIDYEGRDLGRARLLEDDERCG